MEKDKITLYSPNGKDTITVFESDVENLVANGWTVEKQSGTKTKTNNEDK
jgi:hypothetical protein